MKVPIFFFFLAGLIIATIGFSEEEKDKFGDTSFMAYEGQQEWPLGTKTEVIKDFAVPIYLGLPTQKYKVLGRIYDARQEGIGILGRVFSEGLFSEKDRQRDCANQAKFRGGDAVLVTNDDRIIKVFGLDKDALENSTPLFDHKNCVTLAIKFL